MDRVNILGVGVSAVNIKTTIDTIDNWLSQEESNYICVTGVHGIIESQRDERLREIHNNAGLVVPDGMPLVWLSRIKGYSDVARVYGPDLMLAFCNHSLAKGYRHFLYGGNIGVPEILAEKLKQRFPGLGIVGMYSPPFQEMKKDDDDKIVDLINASHADIVWIGLSTPKQERWMHEHRLKFPGSILIGVGAAFDFHAGLKKQAPKWMQRSGFEWFYRLMTEPRRLWRRYMVNNPLFIFLIIAQALGLKKYQIPE